MSFPSQSHEEYRISFALLHLCMAVQESLPARSRAGQDLLFHCGQVSVLIASAAAELTRAASVCKLADARQHASDVDSVLQLLRRRQRGSQAHVTAALEICERLAEHLTRRIERRRGGS